MAETQNLSVFDFPLRPKHCFSHFLLFSHGGNEIFAVFYSSAAAESQFSAFFRFQPWMTNDFSWKLMIYPRIWTAFSENRQFTIVFKQFFLKIGNLLSYLNSFFWKSAIYYRIWIVFPENRQFTIVSEQFFLKIGNLLSYLNSFSWKSAIYYRIWTVFPENRQFTIVFE